MPLTEATGRDSAVPQTAQSTAASYQFTGLTPGVTYTVVCNAMGAAGPSNWSSPMSLMVVWTGFTPQTTRRNVVYSGGFVLLENPARRNWPENLKGGTHASGFFENRIIHKRGHLGRARHSARRARARRGKPVLSH